MKLIVTENSGKSALILKLIRQAKLEGYKVFACGDFAGLSVKSFSFDKSFAPIYAVQATKVAKKLKEYIKEADEVLALTDPGFEGEALALQVSLFADKLSTSFSRLVLREFTSDSLLACLESPSSLDFVKIDAFLASEFVDRVVRYKLGSSVESRLGTAHLDRMPILILSLLAKKERSIRRFREKDVFVSRALLESGAVAEKEFASEKEAKHAVSLFRVADPSYHSAFEKAPPPPPFTTSSVLQFMSSRYGLLPSQTVKGLETLYGLGYTTAPYTSSVYLSESFIDSVRSYISSSFGDAFLSDEARSFSDSGPQESIRPVDISVSPSKSRLKGDLKRLYAAIWFRSVGSQGQDALLEKQRCVYENNGESLFEASGTALSRPGWHQLTSKLFLEPKPQLNVEALALVEASYVRKQTKPPIRHSSSTVLSWLDSLLIGRPRNYAYALSSLLENGYCQERHGLLQITSQGEALVTFIRKAVPDLLDPDFHAEVEEGIDAVAAGHSFSDFANFYWDWLSAQVLSVEKKRLRAQFRSPKGERMQVWVFPDRVVAFEQKGDWKTPVSFDEKGRIVPDSV